MSLNKNSYTLVPHPMKNKTLTFFRAAFSLFAVFLLTSCEFWHQPVRDYFEKWTNEIAIEKFEVTGVESYEDKDGNLCIGSEQPAPMTLIMRNPYHYTLEPANIRSAAGFPEISQDSEDTTLLHFTYGTDYLLARDGGQELGAEVAVIHPWRHEEKSYTFSLKCNSKPPKVQEAAILYRTVSGQNYYVLAFYCPAQDKCNSSGIHRDIVSVSINDQSYSAIPDANGNLVFADSEKFVRGIRDGLHTLNKDFNDSERAVYFISSDPVIDGVDKSFTIGFIDSAGLENPITLDTKVPSLAAPTVKNNDDAELSLDDVNIVHTESGQVYSVVTIHAPSTDSTGNVLERPEEIPAIKWEMYQGNSTAGPKLEDGIEMSNSSGTASLKIPGEGEYTLVVWAEKSGYTQSAYSYYHIKLEYATLKAPEVRNLTLNSSTYNELLSSTATNNYIELKKSVNKYFIDLRIEVPTKTTADEYVPINSRENNATIILYKINQGKTINETENYQTKDDGTFIYNNEGFGQYCLTVYATKPGYKESDHVSYLIKAHNDELYVAGDGNDEAGDGSEDHPYATIQYAVDEFKAYNDSTKDYTLNVSGTLSGGQTVSGLSGKAKSLSIKGTNSATINANYQSNALRISGSGKVSLENITITKGRASEGGGLYLTSSEVTIKTDTKIISNKADISYSCGGGVYVKGDATVTLDGGTIGGSDSDANWAGSSGGAVYIENGGTLTLKSGSISYNHVDNSGSVGGAIYNNGTLNIYGGTISNNHSNSSGGGIYNYNALNIYGGTIDSNYTQTYGGGIYNFRNLNLSYADESPDGCTISGNYTTGSYSKGGGVFNDTSANFVMSKGTISGNHTDSTGYGGGVYAYSYFTMSGGTIIGNNDNLPESQGKGVFVASGSFTMSGSALVNANNDVYLNTVRLRIGDEGMGEGSGATITPNTWTRNKNILTGNVTDDNMAKFKLSDRDWKIVKYNGDGVTDADFYVSQDGNNNNLGTSSSPYKTIQKAAEGCWWNQREFNIYIMGELEGPQTINNSNTIQAKKITLQQATGYDGKLNGKQEGTTLTISRSSLTVNIESLSIIGGKADNGGGIKIDGNSTTVILGKAANIDQNIANSDGGGVWVGSNSALCIHNTATIGIWSGSDSGDEIDADNCGNKAKYGGGIYNIGKVYLGYKDVGETDGATNGLRNNFATQGGGIYNLGSGQIYINSGKIYGNRAESSNGIAGAGGGISFKSGTLTMTGGEILWNYATNNAGGISIEAVGCTFTSGTIQTNRAGSIGGAIRATKTFSIGSGVNIPYWGSPKYNDVYLSTESGSPSIKTGTSTFTKLSADNPIHITGSDSIYDTDYTVLTGGTSDNIAHTSNFIEVEDYDGWIWYVYPTTGKMQKDRRR